MRKTLLIAAAATLAVMSVVSGASAQGRRHYKSMPSYTLAQNDYSTSGIPLTVNRRSWLDPGPVAPHGSEQAYMAASTQFAKSQDQIFGPDRYGNDVMQGQPYVPGRTVPVVEFSTYPNGGVVVDNTIGYQNYYLNPAPSVPAANPPLVTGSDTVVPNVP